MVARRGVRQSLVFRLGLAAGIGALACATAPAAWALSWGAPTTVSASGEVAQAGPSTAMDAAGDAIVAWSNYHSTNFDCPCQARVALRPAGGPFGAPITLGADTTVSDVQAAMDSSGDSIVAWNQVVSNSHAPDGQDIEVVADFRPAGGSFAGPQVLSVQSASSEAGGPPVVAMDAAGDSIVTWISGLGWWTGSNPEPQLQVVRGDNTGSFSSPSAVTGSGADGPFDNLALAMSPDGHAAITYTRCSPADSCGEVPGGNPGAQNEVQVVRAAPGAAFGSPATISPVVTNPGTGEGPYEQAQSVAIDEAGDVVASYQQTGTGSITSSSTTRRDEVVTSDAGGSFSSPQSLGASGRSFAGQVAITPAGQSIVTYTDSGGLEARSRSLGGSFGAAQLLSGAADGQALILNSNSSGASGEALEGLELNPGFDGTKESVAAEVRPVGDAFGAPASVASMPSGSFFNEGSISGAIDKAGDAAALAWEQFTGGNFFDNTPGPIRVALAGNAPTTHRLTVTKSGAGSLTSSPAGISCGSVCSHAFAAGTKVTISEHPARGYRFIGWSGGCSGTGACAVTMSADKSVRATFRPIPPPDTSIAAVKLNKRRHSAKVSFSGRGGVGTLHFKCKLDRGRFTSCSSPKTYKHLKKGKHTVEVEAIDSRGAVDPTPAKQAFRLT